MGSGISMRLASADSIAAYESSSPSFRSRRFFILVVQLPLPWLWTLYERAILAMELAQNTRRLSLMHHASRLPPSTGVTRPLFTTCRSTVSTLGHATWFRFGLVTVGIIAVSRSWFGGNGYWCCPWDDYGSRHTDRKSGNPTLGV